MYDVRIPPLGAQYTTTDARVELGNSHGRHRRVVMFEIHLNLKKLLTYLALIFFPSFSTCQVK
jgi:hypothetical protein